MLQQAPALGDPQLQVVAHRRGSELLLEQSLDLPPRAPHVVGELLLAERFLDIRRHQVDHFAQRLAHLLVQGGAHPPVARLLEGEDIHHRLHQVAPVAPGDPLQRQVEGAGGAGRGQAVAVDHIAVAGHLAVAGDLGEGGAVLGMDAAAVAIQQAGVAEEPGTVPQPGQGDAARRHVLQRFPQRGGRAQGRAQTAADHQQVESLQRRRGERQVRADQQPEVAGHRLAAQAEVAHREGLAADQVGGHQGVQRLGEGRQGKVFEQQEAHPRPCRAPLPGPGEPEVLPLQGGAETPSFHRFVPLVLLVPGQRAATPAVTAKTPGAPSYAQAM